MKVTEAHLQAVLMRWLMVKKHHVGIIPNSNQFFFWEADLISITASGLVHEFEIKLNIYDYKADAQKRKHNWIGDASHTPAYFWYVTYDFEIEPPPKAGWILISRLGDQWPLEVKVPAPRLNSWKIDEYRQRQMTRILSWHLCRSYVKLYLKCGEDVNASF
jgi:hypothetical protein